MNQKQKEKASEAIIQLLEVMEELRSDHGCPWDKEQNHETLKKHLIEESYEVIDAINNKDDDNLCEELGDVLFQVVFHSYLGEQRNKFDFTDIANGISEKMIRRHPHVFGEDHCDTSDEVLIKWDKIKAGEKGHKKEKRALDIPDSFPALLYSQKIQKKAADYGFDWDNSNDIKEKVSEEFNEVQKSIAENSNIEEEMGDLLFSVVNWCRFHNINAEEAMRSSANKFRNRFYKMEDAITYDGKDIHKMTLKEMDKYWDKIKENEKQ